MKICLTNLSFKKISFKDFILNSSRYNFQNFEVAPSLINKNIFKKSLRKKILVDLRKNKCKILLLQSIFYKYSKIKIKSKKDLLKLTNHFKKVILLCKHLDIKQVSIGSCPTRKIKNKKIIHSLNSFFFKEICEIAKKKSVTINLEPISKKYDNLFLNTPYEALKFISSLRQNNLKLLLDTGNCKIEKVNFKRFYIKNQKIINHVQISNKNINICDTKMIKDEIKFFKKQKFNKTLTLEFFSPKSKKLSEIRNNLIESKF